MKHKLLNTLALIVLVMVAFVNSPAGAASAAGPYYAVPSWDQTLACTAINNCPRFIVLTNMNSEAVLDRETGLVWEKSPGDTDHDGDVDVNDRRNLSFAQSHCNRLTVGNRKGWRIPTVQELASLVDPSVPLPGPTLPAGHPFSNVQSDSYWSATTSTLVGNSAWTVSFNDGDVNVSTKSVEDLVWCVRGGQGVDPQ
jgi:hypothetical protein